MTGSESRATVGLVLVRPSQMLGSEPFYQEFIAGLEGVFGPRDVSVLLQVVPSRLDEDATYTRWAQQHTVSGVLLVDLEPADARVALLHSIGMRTVVVGDPGTAGPYPSVWTDDALAVRHAVEALVDLGHSVLARVSGPGNLAHSQIRTAAFHEVSGALGVTALEVMGDYTEEAGRLATLRLLEGPVRPTAIVYDDDLMALGGLAAATAAGLRVPDDISMVAWDDSALCQLSEPPLAVMGHDVQAIGELTASVMLDELAEQGSSAHQAPTAVFLSRESVGPVRRR